MGPGVDGFRPGPAEALYVAPRHVTIWQGIAYPQTLAFTGVGLTVVVPIVLAYQAHTYWVVRGKTKAHDGYSALSANDSDRAGCERM